MLRKKFLRINTSFNEYRYKASKREHQRLVRRDKNSYYKNKLDQSKGDSGKIWRLINEILCRDTDKRGTIKRKDTIEYNGKIHNTSKEISNCFNEYYCNIGIKIAKDLKKTCLYFWSLFEQSPPKRT